MPSLADIQRGFAAAIRDRELPPPPGTVGRRGEPPVRRFSVYRNNVHVSLVEALAETFPVVARLVGEDFFRAMARAFVADHLPCTPVLIDYGDGFPDFVATFAPAASLPYLADVGRLEWAWSRAYHASDRAPLSAAEIANIDPQRLPAAGFVLHPSLQVVSSDWPVLDIWETNSNDAEVRPVDLSAGGFDVVVLRPDLEVELHRLAPGWRAVLDRLQAGASVGAAYEAAAGDGAAIDLAAFLRWLIGVGAIVEVVFPEPGEPRP